MKVLWLLAAAMSVMTTAQPAQAVCSMPLATYTVPAEKGFDRARNSRFLRWQFPAYVVAPIRTSAGSLTIYLDNKTFTASYSVTNESTTDRYIAYYSFFITTQGPDAETLGNDTFVLGTDRFSRDIDYNLGCAGAEDQLRNRIFHRTVFLTGTSGFNLPAGGSESFNQSGSMLLLTQRRGTAPRIWGDVIGRLYENPPPLQFILARFPTNYAGPVGRDPPR